MLEERYIPEDRFLHSHCYEELTSKTRRLSLPISVLMPHLNNIGPNSYNSMDLYSDPSSNLGRYFCYHNKSFRVFFKFLLVNARIITRLRHGRFLPDPFKFIIILQSYYLLATYAFNIPSGEGSLKCEKVKYGLKFQGTRTRERLRWQGPAAYTKDRPDLWSERAPLKNKTVTVTHVINIWS
jgi:hypothetical protein